MKSLFRLGLVVGMLGSVPVFAEEAAKTVAVSEDAAAVKSTVDELIKMLEEKKYDDFIARAFDPDEPEVKDPEFKKMILPQVEAGVFLGMMKEVQGKDWTVSEDGQKATLKIEGASAEESITATMVKRGDKWYMGK